MVRYPSLLVEAQASEYRKLEMEWRRDHEWCTGDRERGDAREDDRELMHSFACGRRRTKGERLGYLEAYMQVWEK